ncbi:hypothetical protein ABTD09_21215, partial [Acinetobacter baumannii]
EDLAGNTWQHCKFLVVPVGLFLLALLSRTTIEGEKLDSISKYSFFSSFLFCFHEEIFCP